MVAPPKTKKLYAELQEEIKQLARVRNAVILAHNYERPEVQDVADFVGDSLGLSREAAKTKADVIVFCGVHFMAETAAVLSPQKTVLLPDLAAGCSLAATIDAEQLREWKAEHPGAVVVSYVNTTAEVKAESDYCCTSGNAVEIVNSIPADQEVLFLPDMFLGAHVRRITGRKNMHVWMEVEAGIKALPEGITKSRWWTRTLSWTGVQLLSRGRRTKVVNPGKRDTLSRSIRISSPAMPILLSTTSTLTAWMKPRTRCAGRSSANRRSLTF